VKESRTQWRSLEEQAFTGSRSVRPILTDVKRIVDVSRLEFSADSIPHDAGSNVSLTDEFGIRELAKNVGALKASFVAGHFISHS
jgi:hypothetical protein